MGQHVVPLGFDCGHALPDCTLVRGLEEEGWCPWPGERYLGLSIWRLHATKLVPMALNSGCTANLLAIEELDTAGLLRPPPLERGDLDDTTCQ